MKAALTWLAEFCIALLLGCAHLLDDQQYPLLTFALEVGHE
jgi:hypothetical protein